MSLSTGLYTIRSAAFREPYVGRAFIETADVSPKAILKTPSNEPTPEWTIENLQDGRYYLRTRGAPTAVINDLVFAIILSKPPGEQWDLEQIPQYGENQYLIHTNNGTIGWVLPRKDDFTQVAARALIVQPSFPPQYPANQRWIIESLEDLD